MHSSLHEYFQKHPAFRQMRGVFVQQNITQTTDFERSYLQLREQEGRIYDDHFVATLPRTQNDHPLRKEWMVRETTADRLAAYLRNISAKELLEIGCGNGWLTHYLHQSLRLDCAGIDLNITELEQAERVFGPNQQVTFVYGDILSDTFESSLADVIVVPSAVQYFPDLTILVSKLLQLLHPSGEIHILDSPIYTTGKVRLAHERTLAYFKSTGHESMSQHYYHHTWESLQAFKYDVLYNPDSWQNRARRLFRTDSPFPWIRISRPDF